jgi:hypothetical protein
MNDAKITKKQWEKVAANSGLIGDMFTRKFKEFSYPHVQNDVRLLLEQTFQSALIKAVRTHNGRTKFGYWFNFIALQHGRQDLQRYYKNRRTERQVMRKFCEPVYDPDPNESEDIARVVDSLIARTIKALGWPKQHADMVVKYLGKKVSIRNASLALHKSPTWLLDRVKEFKNTAREMATESDRLLAEY